VTQIAVYNEFRAQLAELKAHNSSIVFDYEDSRGNKAARSHVYKLRQTKSAVDKARKTEKAASLEYGRQVDAQAKQIIDEIEVMIDVHAQPLEEIERREAERVRAIQDRISTIRDAASATDATDAPLSAAALRDRLQEIKAAQIDESFAEFQLDAAKAKDATLAALEAQIAAAEKREAEAAELARLRKEAEERAQREREEQIRREAEQRAREHAEAAARREREAAEQKARQERAAAERRELELKLAAERAEREKAEAEARAQCAADQERQRIIAEEKARADEIARREADRKHQAKIHGAIIAALAGCGVGEEQAKAVIAAIRKGDVPHLTIGY